MQSEKIQVCYPQKEAKSIRPRLGSGSTQHCSAHTAGSLGIDSLLRSLHVKCEQWYSSLYEMFHASRNKYLRCSVGPYSYKIHCNRKLGGKKATKSQWDTVNGHQNHPLSTSIAFSIQQPLLSCAKPPLSSSSGLTWLPLMVNMCVGVGVSIMPLLSSPQAFNSFESRWQVNENVVATFWLP